MAISELFRFASKYDNMTDEELIEQIRLGDLRAQNYLLEKYKPLVYIKSKNLFLQGAENDDIIQEGMIGVFKAIKSFDTDKNNSFKTFANMCVERQLISAIKSSNRQKHMPLNSSFSLNTAVYDNDDDTTIIDILDTKTAEDPLDTITKKEYIEFVENKIDKNLSNFEKQVLERYIQGESYVDIADKLNSPVKSIDNAIQRIRKKAEKCLNDDE